MEVYTINLIIVVFIAVVTSKKKMNKWISILLITIPLVCVSGFRWRVGTDFQTYFSSFEQIPNYTLEFLLGKTYSDFIPFERGFSILIWIMGLINKEPQFMVFMTSLINISIVIYTLKKHSSSFTMSIYLYITTMVYYSAFNGIRQWIASVFLFWGMQYIIDKNWVKYLICVLIASTIHISALIMIPLYFVIDSKPFGKKMIIVIVVFMILSIFLEPILQKFESLVTDTRYADYTNLEGDDGVNIFRVLVAAIPVIISALFYKRLKEDKEIDILINFSTINFLILFLAMKSTIVARFNMYFELYNVLLYPKFLKLFKKDVRYVFIYILGICFLAYMYLLLPVDSNLLPYRTFWNK